MRWFRLAPILVLAALMTACLEVETNITLFQDGSGVYQDRIGFPQKMLELVRGSMELEGVNEMFAEGLLEVQDSLDEAPGVRLMDAGASCQSDADLPTCRFNMLFAFNDIESWNRFANKTKRYQIKMETEQWDMQAASSSTETTVVNEPPGQESRQAKVLLWQVTLSTPTAAGILESFGQPEGQSPSDNPQDSLALPNDPESLNLGSVNLTITGPGPAAEENFASEEEGYRVARLVDGSVQYASSLTALMVLNEFNVRFISPPLTPEELAARKAHTFVEPSPEFLRMLEIVERMREERSVQQAAAQGISDTTFELRLQILEKNKVGISSTRTYYGPTASYFAQREAMLYAMTPAVAANYRLSFIRVENDEQGPGVAVTRVRREPLSLAALAGRIEVKRDGQDTVYRFFVDRLLDEIDPTEDEYVENLGLLVVETPTPIAGTTGEATGPRRVELRLGMGDLRQKTTLVVRTSAAAVD